MKTEEDIQLFTSNDDIDLFGDIDSMFEDEQDTEQGSTDEIDPELIRQSVLEFHKLFTEREGSLSAGSGAMIIYQHLQSAGYNCSISVEDTKSEVSAFSANEALQPALIERVEDLLDEMVFIEHDWQTDNFTVTSIVTNCSDNGFGVTIKFKAI